MSTIADDTKGGFNAVVEDQREEAGEATITLYEFDSEVRQLFEGYPVAEAPELTDENYTPGGSTALHDAIYRATNETAEHVDALAIDDQPDNVVVVILTDGKENASETSQARVQEQVKIRQNEHDWEFLFIGAKQDAALTAEKVGVEASRSLDMDHSGEGVRSAYESSSERISHARREGTTDEFTDEDREKQERADN